MTKQRSFNRRVINLSYFPEDLPKFETQAELDDWYKAVGRMVLYGMGDFEEDTIEIINASITKNPLEFHATYSSRLPATDVKCDQGYPVYYKGDLAKIDAVLTPLRDKASDKGNPFTMAAVKHSDGKFGFHS